VPFVRHTELRTPLRSGVRFGSCFEVSFFKTYITFALLSPRCSASAARFSHLPETSSGWFPNMMINCTNMATGTASVQGFQFALPDTEGRHTFRRYGAAMKVMKASAFDRFHRTTKNVAAHRWARAGLA
jgi:hypothetical protein